MAKRFFEVFPSLKLEKKTQDLFEQVLVDKVSATKSRDYVRVTVSSAYLIPKETVLKVEKEIKKQFFSSCNMRVKLYERFLLSEQYTPEKLMDVYKDSILLELRQYSPVEYHLLKGADIAFLGMEEIGLTIEDTILGRSKAAELSRILEKIFNERCGFSVHCKIDYKEKIVERNEEELAFVRLAPGSAAEKSAPVKETGGTKAAGAESPGKERRTGGFAGKGTLAGGEASGKNGGRGEFKRALKRSDNPDVIYGRDFEEDAIPIEDVIGEMGEVVIRGKIINLDSRDIRNEKKIIMFDVTDFTDTMTVKLFIHSGQSEELMAEICKGAFIKLKGAPTIDRFDNELTIGSLAGIKKIPDFTVSRRDDSPRKRVELHCHTKMSDMDGVAEAKDIVKRAYKWGHPAIAITDHGVVQAFPDANHVWEDLWKAEKARRKEAGEDHPDKQDFFKIIYGMEAYLVDDLQEIVTGEKGQDFHGDFVVFDIETTGFSPVNNRIIEIGAVKVSEGKIVDRFSSFVNPDVPVPFEIVKLTGITDSMVSEAPFIDTVLPQFLDFCGDAVLVAHNANFDMSFIKENALRQNIGRQFTYVDTVAIARILCPIRQSIRWTR